MLARTGTREIFAIVKYYGAAGEHVGTETYSNFISATGVQQLESTSTAPPGAVTAEVTAFYMNGTGAVDFYIDEVYFGEGAPYFDGDSGEWEGTPGDSVSVRTNTLSRTVTHGIAATLIPAGQLGRGIVQGLAARLAPVGGMNLDVVKGFAATWSPDSSMRLGYNVTLKAVLGFIAGLVPRKEVRESPVAAEVTAPESVHAETSQASVHASVTFPQKTTSV